MQTITHVKMPPDGSLNFIFSNLAQYSAKILTKYLNIIFIKFRLLPNPKINN